MSICNMAIEGGARAGMIAPDQVCDIDTSQVTLTVKAFSKIPS